MFENITEETGTALLALPVEKQAEMFRELINKGMEKHQEISAKRSACGKLGGWPKGKKRNSNQYQTIANNNKIKQNDDLLLFGVNSENNTDVKNAFEKETKETAIRVLNRLNEVVHRQFRAVPSTLEPIIARLNSGITYDDCDIVIMNRWNAWSQKPEMYEYLRPETLFGKKKFENYLASAKAEFGGQS